MNISKKLSLFTEGISRGFVDVNSLRINMEGTLLTSRQMRFINANSIAFISNGMGENSASHKEKQYCWHRTCRAGGKDWRVYYYSEITCYFNGPGKCDTCSYDAGDCLTVR